MYIYLKKGAKLSGLVEEGNKCLGLTVFDRHSCPYLVIHHDCEIVMAELKKLKAVFLRATIVYRPQYRVSRTLGEYVVGAAHAFLKRISGTPREYELSIWTETWDGIRDMAELIQKVEAGTILPEQSYEEAQAAYQPTLEAQQIERSTF
ncbi:MAG: hypothetical protein CO073_02965 [Candidatus Komeilibacteria bacterium CG_4_9_14_0_8_um_filter_36_9]|uniref:Uncharacterized protein n=1 Tax=Candidatus Komeilibacteria bacterium CG_4_9_14_0_8_um_filter_36_9 TaxID=1974473 RepID=A0A2M8DQY6_9BACT|nr:MAG: hypothetical protein CO073_02965 [Candidatus Komeilibacteria bacterium CG_4_9_14_0_8_um_filter_36_9]